MSIYEIISPKVEDIKSITTKAATYNERLLKIHKDKHELQNVTKIIELINNSINYLQSNSEKSAEDPLSIFLLHNHYVIASFKMLNIIELFNTSRMNPNIIESTVNATFKEDTLCLLNEINLHIENYESKYRFVDNAFTMQLVKNLLTIVSLKLEPKHGGDAYVGKNFDPFYKYKKYNLEIPQELLDMYNTTYEEVMGKPYEPKVQNNTQYDDNTHNTQHDINTQYDTNTQQEEPAVLQYDDKQVLKIFNDIREIFLKYKRSVELYAVFTQEYLLMIKPHTSPYLQDDILEIIDNDKNYYMVDASYVKKVKKSYIHLQNPSMKRFSLQTISDMLELSDLLIWMKLTVSKIKIEPFIKSVKKHVASIEHVLGKLAKDCNFVVMYKVVPNPVEYNIRKLIDTNEVLLYSQPPTFGISSKMITKYATIKKLGTIDAHSERQYQYYFDYIMIGKYFTPGHVRSDNDIFYILETIDGETFRAKSLWLDAKDAKLHEVYIKPFLDYIMKPNTKDRITAYHEASEQLMKEVMFTDKVLLLETLEKYAININMIKVRNNVMIAMKQFVDNYIDTGSKIKGTKDVLELIQGENFKHAFANSLLLEYKVGTENFEINALETQDDWRFAEILSHFLVEYYSTVRRFIRDINDNYTDSPIKSSVFERKKQEEIIDTVKTKIYTLVNTSIQTILNDQSNLYSSVIYKYMLLSWT